MGKRSDFERVERDYKINPPKRFLDKLSPPDNNGCRLWMGSGTPLGYGSFRLSTHKLVAAHRAAYYFKHGYWPEEVMHKCDVRACCESAISQADLTRKIWLTARQKAGQKALGLGMGIQN